MPIRAVLRVAIGLGITCSVFSATTDAAPTIRVVTKTLTVMGARMPDQAKPLISVTAARLVVNGIPAEKNQSSQPIRTTTRMLVINGRSEK